MISYEQLHRLQPGDKMTMAFHKNPKPSWLQATRGAMARPQASVGELSSGGSPAMPPPMPQEDLSSMPPPPPAQAAQPSGGFFNPMMVEIMNRLRQRQ